MSALPRDFKSLGKCNRRNIFISQVGQFLCVQIRRLLKQIVFDSLQRNVRLKYGLTDIV
jgi:hypothetical protein